MLTGRLASGRAFDVLHAPILDIALAETTSKFGPDLAKSASAVRCHRAIAEPLQKALANSNDIKSVFRTDEDDRADLDVVQIGKALFPMVVRQLKHGQTAIELYPPGKRNDFDFSAAKRLGVAGLYGAKKKDLDRLVVIRGHGPGTDLVVGDKSPMRDVSYAWALFEVAAFALRRANAPKKVTTETRFDPVMEVDVTVEKKKTSGGRLVSALLEGKFGAPSTGPALAHELCGVAVHRGRTVAVTARRATGEGVRVHFETKDGWRSLPIPEDTAWPVGGVTVAQSGNKLHLLGGVDTDGDVLDSHFTVDLDKLDFAGGIEKEPGLDDPSAWASAVADGRDVFIGGGVAGFMVKAGEQRQRDKIVNRGFALVRRGGLAERAPAPGDLTRSYALSHGGCLFFAPGDARDGKVRIYDTSKAGAWLTLPKLPESVGLGQLFVDDLTLYYAGGFTEDGKPHDGIYALDLSDARAEWTKVGQSPFCAGLSRLVDKGDRVEALAIAPGQSAVYTAKGVG